MEMKQREVLDSLTNPFPKQQQMKHTQSLMSGAQKLQGEVSTVRKFFSVEQSEGMLTAAPALSLSLPLSFLCV